MNQFFTILFCCVFFQSFSQNPVNDYITIRDQLKIYGSEGEEAAEKFKGSPYLEEEFEQGVILENGKNEQVAYFRYNVFQDQVEIKVNPADLEVFILPRSDDFRFRVGDYTYFFGEMATDEQEIIAGYLMEFYQNGKTMLLAKPVYHISSAKVAETTYERNKPARIRVNVRYYLGINDEPLRRVSLKEKDFRKVLDSSPQMQQYFAEHRVRGIDDIVDMLQFYDVQN